MARMLTRTNAVRCLVLALAVVTAALNAKGVHTYGFFDGPH